ncbi:hypothetical protein [Apilactobacillus xinyiensis]|uniref:hypothetical protein n=1 Tax=Apilactobacillus xinyiensis TaxID=2841032 RepID=UPI00200EEE64|nr:hypothetical protein [Apilactobacillus xinyiensis]MCL0329425.1 hypothetical protein [Apilactobacillus xinyiensis]
MSKLLDPHLIDTALNNKSAIKLVIAILRDNWDDIYDANPIYKRRINVNDLELAKCIYDAEIVDSKLNFDDYASVHNFVVKNDAFLEISAKDLLLRNFK